jgi:hypothetical protein
MGDSHCENLLHRRLRGLGLLPARSQPRRGDARKIADGSLDRKKQSALYVSITRTGEVGLHPDERLQEFPVPFSDEYLALKEVLPILFATLTNEPA